MIDKTKLKKLAQDSFDNTQMDQRKVKRITKLLNRENLREYIKDLKRIEKKKTIFLVVPDDKISSVSQVAEKISKLYPNKKIMIQMDPTLIAGIRVVNDDLIYEVSLGKILEEAVSKI